MPLSFSHLLFRLMCEPIFMHAQKLIPRLWLVVGVSCRVGLGHFCHTSLRIRQRVYLDILNSIPFFFRNEFHHLFFISSTYTFICKHIGKYVYMFVYFRFGQRTHLCVSIPLSYRFMCLLALIYLCLCVYIFPSIYIYIYIYMLLHVYIDENIVGYIIVPWVQSTLDKTPH